MPAGYAAPSFGLNCAHMAGMREDIIKRAAQVKMLFLAASYGALLIKQTLLCLVQWTLAQ